VKGELIQDTGALGAVEEDWRRLAVARENAFITPDWFRSWWSAYGEEHEPAVVVVRDGEEVKGVLPLVRSEGRPRALRFAGYNLGDCFEAATAPGDEPAVAAAAAAALSEGGLHGVLITDNVPVESAMPAELAGGFAPPLATVPQRTAELPYAALPDSWDEYLAGRSSNLRQKVRRMERVLERDHGLVLRQVAGQEELPKAFDDLFRLHDLRWRDRGGTSLASDRSRDAHRAFAAAALERGWLRLRLIELEGQPAAAFYGWRLGDRYAFYQSGFDPDWSKRSVGLLVVSLALRAAIEEGAAVFDLLLGSEDYKARLADGAREVQTVAMAPPHRPVRLALAAEARMRRVGGRLAGRGGRTAQFVRGVARRMPTGRGD
jgi:CelD/BcsL family acetyltransferase involved in cellulose biosynthesis